MPRKQTMGRAANGNGSIRKKTQIKNGKTYTWYEARITTGYDPNTGKQIQRSVSGKKKEDVAKKIRKLSVEVDEGTYLEPNKMTLAEWLDIWMSDYMGDKKYLTVKNYKSNIETHIKPKLGSVKLQKLVPHMIQRFYNELSDHGCSVPVKDKNGNVQKKDGKVVTSLNPMAAKTVRNIHGTLNKALSVAVSIGYLRSNPAECVILPRVEKKEIHPLTDEQVKEFLKAASSEDYGIALKVILFTGLRESELLGLTWDSVDFKTGSITISKQLLKRKIEDGGSTLSSTKSGKMRIIKPAPFVMELLAQQYKEQAKQRLQSGNQWQGWQTSEEQKTSLVFLTPDGKHLSQTSIRYHFKKVVERIGVPAARVHDLRHTFAVLSLQNGDNIKTVQGNLGHATAAFTLDVYGHVSERMKDDSAARMQAYIDNIS